VPSDPCTGGCTLWLDVALGAGDIPVLRRAIRSSGAGSVLGFVVPKVSRSGRDGAAWTRPNSSTFWVGLLVPVSFVQIANAATHAEPRTSPSVPWRVPVNRSSQSWLKSLNASWPSEGNALLSQVRRW